ncbi:MAG: S49 family peptidase, partial [Gammaproteobacteria bacterium]|nr:S49 family peptidase [Gammaproteobacteria bacterium]
MSDDHSQPSTQSGRSPASWERELLERFAFEALKEQRRSRRWGTFFKLATLAYVTLLVGMLLPSIWKDSIGSPDKITALVDINGVISSESEASADSVVTGLRAAFKNDKTAGVIVRINSPGGSPVQAGYINDEIYRLKQEYPDIPLYAVIRDVCASGGYYIAVAADEIYADKASMVGSIGVRMDSFGFVEALDKLGVERRLLTAGQHKGFLDPFLPVREEEVDHISTLLGDVHQQFIDTVKKGRGDRLKNSPLLFSGFVWTGAQGLELGLVDRLGSSGYVAREIIGAEDIVDFTTRVSYLDRFARGVGASITAALE